MGRRPATRPPPLRIGILRDAEATFEAWELELIERLLADRRFALAAFIDPSEPYRKHGLNPFARLVLNLDQGLFARQPPFQARRFANARRAIRHVAADDAARFPSLDLILRHVPAPLPASVARRLPFGLWTLSHVETQSGGVNWSGVSDRVTGQPTTVLRLQIRHGRKTHAVAEAAFNTKVSAARNTAFIKEKSVLLLMRELRLIAETRTLPPPLPGPTAEDAAPGFVQTALYAAKLARDAGAQAVRALSRRFRPDSAVWTLYAGRGAIDDFDPSLAVEIPPSPTSIRADPFLFRHEGETYVFYENYGLGDARAHIAVGRLAGDRLEPIGIALGGDEHLSFPFVFRDGNDIFLMPETHQRKRIEIWRAVSFPLVWEPYSSTLEGWSAADSTLFRHHGHWWLLSNLSDHHAFEDHCSALYAFEVDGPRLAKVAPHRCNPVVIGSATARNAGRVFSRHRRLYRPAQYNAHGLYGYGLNIMEIERLDRDTYQERCVRRIVPDFKPGLIGCHHFDALNSRYILDARLSV